jgi:hypothetical protein
MAQCTGCSNRSSAAMRAAALAATALLGIGCGDKDGGDSGGDTSDTADGGGVGGSDYGAMDMGTSSAPEGGGFGYDPSDQGSSTIVKRP